jgi:hypothetical protein
MTVNNVFCHFSYLKCISIVAFHVLQLANSKVEFLNVVSVL